MTESLDGIHKCQHEDWKMLRQCKTILGVIWDFLKYIFKGEKTQTHTHTQICTIFI